MSTMTLTRPTGLNANVILRPGTPDDAVTIGNICHEAFTVFSAKHGFPSDFPTPESGIGLATMLLAHPGFSSVVAEIDGMIVGSNFLDERAIVAGVGPITVSPVAQNAGVGRMLMQAVLERAEERGMAGVRLLQAAYHGRSLSLYASLGFEAREPIACMQGPAIGITIHGHEVRPATFVDLAACNRLARTIHGFDRTIELSDALGTGSALVLERGGRITGYTTATAFFGHTVGETTEDVKALIGAAESFDGPGILIPIRNSALFQWCLVHGLRVSFPMTLMSVGLYNEPAGAFLPSVLF
jgi:predicted N-acetyltransferase YhbS